MSLPVRGLTSLMVIALLGLMSGVVQAQQPCTTLSWDHPGHLKLGSFRIYVSSTSGDYRFGQAFGVGGYVASIPAIPTMLTSVDCRQLVLAGPGPYYAVATAVSLDLKEESAPSNEVVFGNASSPLPPLPPPEPPPAPPDRPVAELTPPPPRTPFPTALPPTPPSVRVQSDYISESCVWNGLPNCP